MTMIDTLKGSEFFSGLAQRSLEKISELCRTVNFKEGATIFREGDEAKELYVLADGKISLELAIQPVPERAVIPTAVEVVTRGETFGWSALVEPYHYTLSARCMTGCNVLAIKGEVFREVMTKDPALGYEVMKALAKLIAARLHQTRSRLISGLGVAIHA